MPDGWGTGDVVFDTYRVEQVITSGNMGVVYRVRHLGWEVDLAVKAPRPDLVATESSRARFEREAESWVDLGLHPNTVACAYVRRHEGVPLVFAEWVGGGTLADAIAGRRFRDGPVVANLLDVAIQFAWGVRHAHTAGLVHQDLKPANVMITSAGVVKVTDFGLARARELAAEAGPARPGGTLAAGYGGLTEAYCSPEQAAARHTTGSRAVMTRATDVWSWALTVLELFAGRRLTGHGQAADAVFQRWLSRAPEAALMPAAVAALLGACFERDPARRTVRMNDVVEVLKAAYADGTGRPYPRPEPSTARLRADGLNNHALSLLDLGRPEQARESWREALRAVPYHQHSTFNLGLHQWRAGEITDGDLIERLDDDHLRGLVRLEGGDVPAAARLLDSTARPEFLAALRRARDGDDLTLDPLDGGATAVVITPDGRFAAAASDSTVRVWRTADGSPVCRISAPGRGLAISADGSVVARADQVWDTATGVRRARLEPVLEPNAVVLSPDGTLLAVASADNDLILWETASGRVRHVLQRPAPFAPRGDRVLRFSADGRVLRLTRSGQRRVLSWDTERGFQVDAEDEASAVVRRFDLTAGGEFWDRTAGRRLRVFDDCRVGALSADGDVAVTAGGSVRLRRGLTAPTVRAPWARDRPRSPESLVSDAARVRRLLDEAAAAPPPAAAALLRTAMSLPGRERDAEILDRWAPLARSGRRTALRDAWPVRDLPREAAKSLRLAGDGGTAVLVRTWAVDVVDMRSGAVRTVLDEHRSEIRDVAVDTGADLAVTASADRTLRVWTLSDGVCRHVLDAPGPFARSVRLAAGGRLAVSVHEDGAVRLWDPRAGRELAAPARSATRVLPSEDGTVLLLVEPHGRLSVLDPWTGRIREGPGGAVDDPVALSADGRVALLAENGGGAVWVWHVDTGEFGGRIIGRSAMLAGEHTALTMTRGGPLRVWDLGTGRCVRAIGAHVTSARPAGERFVLTREDSAEIRMWDLRDGTAVCSLGTGESLLMTGDPRYAVIGDRLWELNWDVEFPEVQP
ncbi:WD40 repeat domain-containing serine/threonine protein kinase [Actinoplanes sp. G11-F43]|uniref:WD40 repeat domain-containing serine/threonine protein kinase n=1 Tax=Actinoplanes sp. G11-F43 TaxID=3424130 RepID=UPI003D33DAAF